MAPRKKSKEKEREKRKEGRDQLQRGNAWRSFYCNFHTNLIKLQFSINTSFFLEINL
jgi:hypothetical protein